MKKDKRAKRNLDGVPRGQIKEGLEEEGAHATQFVLFFDEDFEVLVDDRHGEENARARADGPEQIGQDGQGADAKPTERRGRGDVTVQLVDHRLLPMPVHHPTTEK